MNRVGNLADHLKYLDGRMIDVTKKISNIVSGYAMKNVQMQTIKIMIENTINSVLGYGLEPYRLNKGDWEKIRIKQHKAIREVIGVSRYVPGLCMLIDLGLNDIVYEIYKRKIFFYRELLMNKERVEKNWPGKKVLLEEARLCNREWAKGMKDIMNMFHIHNS